MRAIQYLWQHDRCSHRLLGRFHALCHGRHSSKLPPFRLPFRQFRLANRPRIQISQLLEVRSKPAAQKRGIDQVSADICGFSFGGREKSLKDKAAHEASSLVDQAKDAATKVEGKAKEVVNKVTSS